MDPNANNPVGGGQGQTSDFGGAPPNPPTPPNPPVPPTGGQDPFGQGAAPMPPVPPASDMNAGQQPYGQNPYQQQPYQPQPPMGGHQQQQTQQPYGQQPYGQNPYQQQPYQPQPPMDGHQPQTHQPYGQNPYQQQPYQPQPPMAQQPQPQQPYGQNPYQQQPYQPQPPMGQQPFGGGNPYGDPNSGGFQPTVQAGDQDEDTTPANFQLGTKFADELKVPVQTHELSFDEKYFIRLLAGSISLAKDEKKRIIDSIPKLKQSQIDELIRIFEEEKQKFAALSKKHVPQLEKLVDQHYSEWMQLEDEYAQTGLKQEDDDKAEEIRKQLGV